MINFKRAGKILIFAFCVVFAVCICMQTALFAVCLAEEYWRPDYAETDISDILAKSSLDESDYDLLFRQTGLTKTGIDRCLKRGADGVKKILTIQENYFTEYRVETDYFAPFCAADYIGGNAEACYLSDGDIIVTPATLFSGYRIGHAAIVTDGERSRILAATRYGARSSFSTVKEFTKRPAFAILSPKADEAVKKSVAEYAESNLSGKRYGIAAGIFGGRNKCEITQCAHLVRYAYKKFGIDLGGGLIVTPDNLFRSDKTELVQVFGYGNIFFH